MGDGPKGTRACVHGSTKVLVRGSIDEEPTIRSIKELFEKYAICTEKKENDTCLVKVPNPALEIQVLGPEIPEITPVNKDDIDWMPLDMIFKYNKGSHYPLIRYKIGIAGIYGSLGNIKEKDPTQLEILDLHKVTNPADHYYVELTTSILHPFLTRVPGQNNKEYKFVLPAFAIDEFNNKVLLQQSANCFHEGIVFDHETMLDEDVYCIRFYGGLREAISEPSDFKAELQNEVQGNLDTFISKNTKNGIQLSERTKTNFMFDIVDEFIEAKIEAYRKDNGIKPLTDSVEHTENFFPITNCVATGSLNIQHHLHRRIIKGVAIEEIFKS